jgi:hypothetical protein
MGKHIILPRISPQIQFSKTKFYLLTRLNSIQQIHFQIMTNSDSKNLNSIHRQNLFQTLTQS